MSLKDLNPHHLRLVSTYATRYAVRGGTGLVFLLVVLTFGLLAAGAIITPVEDWKRTEEKRTGNDIPMGTYVSYLVDQARPAIEWAVGDPKAEPSYADSGQAEEVRAWARYLLDERPALLSAVLLILVFAMPFLVVTGAFNQYSGDVATRGIRYQLLRTERANIYFGRFLGTVLYSALTMALLVLTIVCYMGLRLDIYTWGELLLWGLWGFLGLTIVCLPYVALCGWISGAIDSAFGSLTISAIIVGGVPLFALIGRWAWEPAGYVNYLLPWGLQNNLLHYRFTTVALAGLACLGYTAFFLAVGYRHFAKRDL
ncbi:MAG: hypothetical protein ACYTF8_16190 [Planctomycetota bacterium]|jgi:hypothetical protein